MLPSRLKLRRPLLGLILAMTGYACSISDNLLPQGPSTPAPAPATPAKKPDDTADEGKTIPLGAPQLVRRLALDLTMHLPSSADSSLASAASAGIVQVASAYLNDRASAQALAALHPRMWHLDSHVLVDLDRFAAAGDSSLTAALTTATRQAIVQQPSLAVRYVLEQHLPWHRLYETAQVIVPSTLLSLWGASDLGAAFTGGSGRLATAFGQATAAGLLVDPGLLASINSDSGIYQRTGRLFKELLCIAPTLPSVHNFGALEDSEIAGDLNALSLSKKECAGCHALFAGARQAYSGFANGDSFAAWLQPPAALDTTTGIYASTSFQGLAALGTLVGSDARMRRCEILRLFEELYQRSHTNADQTLVAVALDAFERNGESLTAAARELVIASDYATSPIGSSVKGPGKRGRSGVKVLGRAQWEALFAAVLPQNSLLFTDDLDPGQSESFTSSDRVPSGVYWHAVDRLARQGATAVVSEELADSALATNRHLLTTLPDGAATGASAITVAKQIQDLWLRLTGTPLTDKDQIYIDLQALWTKISPDGTADSSRKAWGLLLTAVFSHPALVTY